MLGRTLTVADDKPGCPGTAVLSYDYWQRAYGGREDVLGRSISLDGHPFEIVGVSQPGFSGPTIGEAVDVTVPICTEAISAPREQFAQQSNRLVAERRRPPQAWYFHQPGRGPSPIR